MRVAYEHWNQLTSDVILKEITNMVEAHANNHRKVENIGIDTLGLIFRKPIIELMGLLMELEEQGNITITPPILTRGIKHRAGSIRLVE